jgi:hypothetical protein
MKNYEDRLAMGQKGKLWGSACLKIVVMAQKADSHRIWSATFSPKPGF